MVSAQTDQRGVAGRLLPPLLVLVWSPDTKTDQNWGAEAPPPPGASQEALVHTLLLLGPAGAGPGGGQDQDLVCGGPALSSSWDPLGQVPVEGRTRTWSVVDQP